MPTTRVRRSRVWQRDLDPYRILSLMNGPHHALLAGHGYYSPQRGGMPDLATADQKADAEAEMARDWSVHNERLLRWWVFDENSPPMKPWTFVGTPNPKTRPWAWWQFEAAEPLPEGETQWQYLERLNLLLPGEAQLPTWEERQADSDATIKAHIEANLAKLKGKRREHSTQQER